MFYTNGFVAVLCLDYRSCCDVARALKSRPNASERGVVVKIDGELFTEYLTKAGHVAGDVADHWADRQADDALVPGRPREDGRNERPSASSIAVVHARRSERRRLLDGKIATIAAPARGPHVAHREFVEVESDGKTARIVTRNDWMNGDEKAL